MQYRYLTAAVLLAFGPAVAAPPPTTALPQAPAPQTVTVETGQVRAAQTPPPAAPAVTWTPATSAGSLAPQTGEATPGAENTAASQASGQTPAQDSAATGGNTPGNAALTAPEGAPPPPPSAAEVRALEQGAPLNRQEIQHLKKGVDEMKRGRAWEPVDVVPRISSRTISLSPGAALPVLRTAPGHPASVVFTDSTGAPWPLGAPPFNGNDTGFFVTYIPDSPVMQVQALRQYDRGSITVYLKGLPVPVIIDVNSGEPDSSSAAQVVDSRLDLRLPRRGPQAKRLPAGDSKIALYDDTLQAFLDGIPPQDAHRLKTQGNVPDTQVWQRGDDLFIRTHSALRDAFEQTLSAGDGTTLYRLPLTPQAAFSVAGKTTYLTINLE